jgi:signal transduction histidine kinase
MLSSLQDFSILHKPMAEPENCNVKSQIEDVWNKVQEEEKVKNVKLYFTDYKVTNVYCNTLLLKLTLHKILQNAVHFQGPNNTNASIEIRVENKSGILLIAVKDNGMGVKGIQVEQLFHMFFRGSEHSKGAGLGLYIAREAIEKLNGKISIHSEIGTEVTIEIPNLC